MNGTNELIKATSAGKATSEVTKTMKFLSDYTNKHFSDEESLQVKSKYPDYSNHIKYHKYFKDKMKELNQKLLKEGVTPMFVKELNVALGDWFINHIKNEDKKVAAHIKASGM